MPKHKQSTLNGLLFITLINYVAQIPYYLHNYYIPNHLLPGLRAIGLLGATFLWFVVGYIAYRKKLRLGYGLLLSFLVVEALFYARAIFTGNFIYQARNPSDIIKVVFVIGYVSGITAAYYAYLVVRSRKAYRT